MIPHFLKKSRGVSMSQEQWNHFRLEVDHISTSVIRLSILANPFP